MRIWIKFLVLCDDVFSAGNVFACAAGGLTQTASRLCPEPINAAHFSPPAAGLKQAGRGQQFSGTKNAWRKDKVLSDSADKKFFVSEQTKKILYVK